MAERVRNSVNKRHVDAASGEIIGQPPAVHTPGSKTLAATLPESGADKQNRRLDCVQLHRANAGAGGWPQAQQRSIPVLRQQSSGAAVQL